MLSRRTLISAIPTIAAAGALAACAKTANGIVLNVAQVDAWGQAALNAAQLVATLPGIAGTAPSVAIAAFAPMISADLKAFDAAAGGKVELTIDTSSPANIANSLLNDFQSLLNALVVAVPNVASTQAQQAQTYLSAFKTIVSLFQAAMGSMTASASAGSMSEAQALKALGAGK